MAEQLFEFLSRIFAPEVVVVILSAMPISEVRGGIPYGVLLGLPLWKTLALAIPANVLVVVPVVLGFNWAAERLADRRLIGGIVSHLLKKARSKEEMVNKYGVWALTLFVAVPLPMTGAWTGAAMAAVFGMHFWRAMGCIIIGVAIASAIVSLLVHGGIQASIFLNGPAMH
ncbi:MAG: small multi-drug export protein [candidate division WS1 bacterium]|nr:small multi-drug export protein [candidate division WS1 bacterium]